MTAPHKKLKEQARKPIEKYRDAAMHTDGDIGCEKISLAKPGDINIYAAAIERDIFRLFQTRSFETTASLRGVTTLSTGT